MSLNPGDPQPPWPPRHHQGGRHSPGWALLPSRRRGLCGGPAAPPGPRAERGRPGQCRSPLLGVQLPLQPPPADESHGAERAPGAAAAAGRSGPGRARPRLGDAERESGERERAGRGRTGMGSPARPVCTAGEAGKAVWGKGREMESVSSEFCALGRAALSLRAPGPPRPARGSPGCVYMAERPPYLRGLK